MFMAVQSVKLKSPGPPSLPPTSSLDALRAHAQAAASMQHHPPTNSPLQLSSSSHSSRQPALEEIKMEPMPDAEPPEEEGHNSPTVLPPREPSPEPRIEDTECHRSQSAM